MGPGRSLLILAIETEDWNHYHPTCVTSLNLQGPERDPWNLQDVILYRYLAGL